MSYVDGQHAICGHERAYFGARFFSTHTGCVEGCPWPEEYRDQPSDEHGQAQD